MPTRNDQLKSILSLLSTSVTKSELESAIRTLVKFVQDLRQANNQEFALMKSAISMLGEQMKTENSTDLAEIKKGAMAYCEQEMKNMQTTMDKMLFEHDAMIAEADAKMDAVVDGDDGHTPTKDELLALITPLIPRVENGKDAKVDVDAIVEQVIAKLPKQDTKVGWGAHPLRVLNSSGTAVEKVARHIKFGTNLTTTRSADGVVTVNASGGAGGGFTALAATEVPNGNRTVFTFATATAQPSYLRVDGLLTKAVSGSGTVNWTWASGPLQATLTIPAQDDIEAIV